MTTNMNTVREVTVRELKAEIDAGSDLFILDLRNADEFAQWKVEGKQPIRTLNIPYFEFLEDEEGSMARLPKDREITLVCAKGGASEYVADLLVQHGYSARNVKGGMKEWSVLYDFRTVVETPEFTLKQVNRVAKGCLSYLLTSRGEALIVDPARHADEYLAAIAAEGLKVAGIVDTHLHADHISGGPELTARTGAPYYVADDDITGATIPYLPLKDGDVLKVGDAVVRVLAIATPGHTPGSSSLLVNDRYFLSGDTIFVESVGRPDLGGKAREWADDLFETLYARLNGLKDDVLVLPAHYSSPGEIRERGLVAERLGRIRAENEALHVSGREQFVAYVLSDLPEQPASYEVMRRVNKGYEPADEEKASELEIGANRCAAKHHGH
jgi:glyoxylase-like metal-dependent hydrolase (beta-lactamase superfamily II)/rhodanese-related sulfurtransferase